MSNTETLWARDDETCTYCGLRHKSVEAGGQWYCPNPACRGCGTEWFNAKLASFEKTDRGYTIDDADSDTAALAYADTLSDEPLAAHIRACVVSRGVPPSSAPVAETPTPEPTLARLLDDLAFSYLHKGDGFMLPGVARLRVEGFVERIRADRADAPWKQVAMQAMRYLSAKQIAAVAQATGSQAFICGDDADTREAAP